MDRLVPVIRLAVLAVLLAAACSRGKPGPLCVEGADRCEGNRLETCNDDGTAWEVTDDCAAAGQLCVAGAGCTACAPGSLACDGQAVIRCRPDGEGFDQVATCDGAAQQVCAAGACQDACALAADSRDYEGCEYWAVDLDNAVVATQGAAAAQQYSVVVSNASLLDADVTVEILCTAADALDPRTPCTPGQPFVVRGPIHMGPGDLRVIDLDPREVDGASRPEFNDGTGTARSRHAYRLHSNAPIIAYQFNPLENVGVFSNDASLLLPTEALAGRYLVPSWPQTLARTEESTSNAGIDLRAFLTVVGTEDGTTVDVQLSTAILGGDDLPAAAQGDTITFTLDRFEVVNLETDGFNADFTGTSVVARGDKRVAVFTGSEASDAPRFDTLATRQCCADHLEEQVFPEDSLGTHFVAVKTPLRSKLVDAAGWNVAVVPDEPEYWRVLATRNPTAVNTNLPPPYDHFSLGRGASVIIEAERDFLFEATEPVAVIQVPASQQATGIPSTLPDGQRPPGGDPSMIWLPPVEQWRNRYLFLVPNKYAFDFVLIAAPASARLIYDGLPIDEVLTCEREPIGTQVPATGGPAVEYLAVRCQLSFPMPGGPGLQDDGVHQLTTEGGDRFGLIVWGWDSFVSYGYPGGSNVERINVQ
ncbi:MAG: IgGFc-binding protein [Kofleriaceae bacterium]